MLLNKIRAAALRFHLALSLWASKKIITVLPLDFPNSPSISVYISSFILQNFVHI